MAVLGASPALTYVPISAQAFSGNSSQTIFTLNNSVGATTDLTVVVDNVHQSPYDGSYSVAGNSLTFSEAPATGTNNIYVLYGVIRAGAVTKQVIPDDGSVTTSKLASPLTTPGNLNVTGALTSTGQFKAPSSMLNGGEAISWASSLFTNIVKGTGDAGSRTTAFVSGISTGSASTWYGNTASVHAAIDSVVGGGLTFWSNNGSSWFQVMDYSHAGPLTLYGGGGGVGLALKNGGDLVLYNADNSQSAAIWVDAQQTGATGVDYIYVNHLANWSQRASYDRGWNNEPSISVHNDTRNGSQATFRIHGTPGYSAGDFSVNLVCDGTVSGSDRRKKTNIQPITNALDKVKRLQGVSYSLVNSELEVQEHMSDAPQGRKFGWIAQDAQLVTPELTKEFEGPIATPKENGWCDGFAIDYQGGVPLLNEAIKEQQVIIEQLLARIEALENK